MTDTHCKPPTKGHAMTTTDNTQPEVVTPTVEPDRMVAKVQTISDKGMSAEFRCARCGAQAYVEVEMPTKKRIEFCAHHYNEHEEALAFQALRVIDHRPFLAHQEHMFKGGVPVKG